MNLDLLNPGAKSSPRSTQEVKSQLDDLAIVRRTAESHGAPDFASKLGLQSIHLHQDSLQRELRAAEMLESGADVELVLDGDPVIQHSVQAVFLGKFLAKIQQLVNATAQAITSVPTARAPVPRNIVAENRLMVTASFVPSSFGVRCNLPTKESLGQLYELDSQTVLETVSELLTDDLPSEDLASLVSHARVKKHYFELLDMLAKDGANIQVRTRRNPYGCKLHAKKARERVEWLELMSAEEERIVLQGVLVGGNIETGRFELKVGEETISGRGTDAAKNELRRITFGAQVRAEVRATTMTHEDGAFEPKTSYVLMSVAMMDQSPTFSMEPQPDIDESAG